MVPWISLESLGVPNAMVPNGYLSFKVLSSSLGFLEILKVP